jgi:predicted nucleic acid-binding protein
MARHLLDSDILIWILRGKKEAVDFVGNLLKEEVPAISSLAFYEVWVGARASEEETISEFLSTFDVISIDQNVAKQAARYNTTYRKKGITLSVADALIAATSKTADLVLVTMNVKHFPMTDLEKRSLP